MGWCVVMRTRADKQKPPAQTLGDEYENVTSGGAGALANPRHATHDRKRKGDRPLGRSPNHLLLIVPHLFYLSSRLIFIHLRDITVDNKRLMLCKNWLHEIHIVTKYTTKPKGITRSRRCKSTFLHEIAVIVRLSTTSSVQGRRRRR
jgi:hypothetical protein